MKNIYWISFLLFVLLASCLNGSSKLGIDTTIKSDTLDFIVTDSFSNNLGNVFPENRVLQKHFKYIGDDKVIIGIGWTNSQNYICEFPTETIEKGKDYTLKFCLNYYGKSGPFSEVMGFHLSNGRTVSFYFKGNVVEK